MDSEERPREWVVPALPQPCAWCEEPVEPGEPGTEFRVQVVPSPLGEWMAQTVPWHRECQARAILGGLNHLQGRCTCCGGTEPPDPPELSRREAARQAMAYAIQRAKPLPGMKNFQYPRDRDGTEG